jgi:hypothetical protein
VSEEKSPQEVSEEVNQQRLLRLQRMSRTFDVLRVAFLLGLVAYQLLTGWK